MAILTTVKLTFKMKASILKAVYSEPFSNKIIRAQIFILQTDNKIADAAEAIKKQKIHYAMLLL